MGVEHDSRVRLPIGSARIVGVIWLTRISIGAVAVLLVSGLDFTVQGVPAAVPQPLQMEAEAEFLSRPELPKDFHFPLLELGFQVLRLRLRNDSELVWTVPESIQIEDPKGKTLRLVTPSEMTPKIVGSKLFRARQRVRDVGPAESVPIYPNPGNYRRYPQGRSAGPAMISVGAAEKVRETLEQYHLEGRELQPGAGLEALIYIKSKKKPNQLEGSRVRLGAWEFRVG